MIHPHLGAVLEGTGNLQTTRGTKLLVKTYVKDKVWPNLKFLLNNDIVGLNKLSKRVWKELKCSDQAWPGLFLRVVLPCIRSEMAARRSNTAQKCKNTFIAGA